MGDNGATLPWAWRRGDMSTVAKAIDNVWDSELLTTRLNTAHVAKFP